MSAEPIRSYSRLGPTLEKPQRESWKDLALCSQVDPDTFFPGKGGDPDPAKKICDSCEVKLTCLRYVMKMEEDPQASRYGVWGGLSSRQRDKLKKLMENDPSLTIEAGWNAIKRAKGRRGAPPKSKLSSQELQAL